MSALCHKRTSRGRPRNPNSDLYPTQLLAARPLKASDSSTGTFSPRASSSSTAKQEVCWITSAIISDQTSVPEWDCQFRFVRVHHEHREKFGRLRLAGIWRCAFVHSTVTLLARAPEHPCP